MIPPSVLCSRRTLNSERRCALPHIHYSEVSGDKAYGTFPSRGQKISDSGSILAAKIRRKSPRNPLLSQSWQETNLAADDDLAQSQSSFPIQCLPYNRTPPHSTHARDG